MWRRKFHFYRALRKRPVKHIWRGVSLCGDFVVEEVNRFTGLKNHHDATRCKTYTVYVLTPNRPHSTGQRQLLLSPDDNYFFRATTIRSFGCDPAVATS